MAKRPVTGLPGAVQHTKRVRKVYLRDATKPDGSAGDADYSVIGGNYSTFRRPEPRIAALIEQALSGAPAAEQGRFRVPRILAED